MLDGIDGREVVRESALQGERKSRSYIDLQRTVMRAPESKSGEETRYIVDAKVRVGHVHLKVCRFAVGAGFLFRRAGAGDNAAVRRRYNRDYVHRT
jgi:hypothetical protein